MRRLALTGAYLTLSVAQIGLFVLALTLSACAVKQPPSVGSGGGTVVDGPWPPPPRQ